MVYCLKCGNTIKDNDLFCRKCGAKKNCNCETFVVDEEPKRSKGSGIVERCKCFFSNFILHR